VGTSVQATAYAWGEAAVRRRACARPVERAWRRRPRPPPIAEPEEIPMATSRILLTSLALLAGMLLVPHAARAAQSYDTCTGFIDSLPATINSQGTWCLRGNVSTAITSGNAIEVAANNVTIDCNGFKIGGLGGGVATRTWGIVANERFNLRVNN